MDILIATSNPGKFREISKFLDGKNIKLLSLKDFPQVEPPEENGETFQENSLIKARYYAEKFHMNVLADDGGLEIDALNGEPGVKSRRWIDGIHEATDEELINFCLQKLKGEKNRKAKLTVCLCLYLTAKNIQKVFYAIESVSGVIAEKSSGAINKGYPFRNLLIIPEIKKYYSEEELTESETKKYNHRYKAVVKIKHELDKYL